MTIKTIRAERAERAKAPLFDAAFRVVAMRARSPFDALTAFACSGQALVPLVKARDFGMTPAS
jgi:hypothetical protein